jgi:glycosyltransferase involved in cell wall biosynthesis
MTHDTRSRRLRVLFCTLNYFPATSGGGAEHQARLQAEELARRGHEVTVVCPRSEGLPSATINGVRVVRLPRLELHRCRTISYLAVLAGFLLARGRRRDVIHVHLAHVQADVIGLVATLIRRPYYVKIACGGAVGEVARLSRIAWLTRWFGLRHAARAQALSQEIAEELLGVGVEPSRIVRIPNGIDLEGFAPAGADAQRTGRDALDLPGAGPLALFVGRFADYKGVNELVEAWNTMERDGANLLLVGAPALDHPADAVLDGPGLLVRGWTQDVGQYLRAADIFVHPSHADGMSNALLEAMASGLSIAAARHRATTELVEDRRHGLLFEPRDSASLARALSELVADARLRERCGREARAKAEQYSIVEVVSAIESAYRELIDERRR